MKIGTHSGTFHCDEALACFMLKQLPEYSKAEIVRSRDPTVLALCDVVVDVGGVYDPALNRFDHHQRTFVDTMSSLSPGKPWTTRLSSAGLVYLHFGRRVIGQVLFLDPEMATVSVIYDKVYENFIQEIDAIDNGVNICDGEQRYAISTNLSSRVSHLNPHWNETSSDEDLDRRFERAMALVGAEFTDRVRFYGQVWWPARDLVRQALNKRLEIDPSGEIMSLHPTVCPWKDHLLELETELGIVGQVKFVLFTDTGGMWRIQCVPAAQHSFSNRLSLMEEWRGVRDEDLSSLSGIAGCTFVHASGFIGGARTYDGVLEMARRTLQKREATVAVGTA